MSDIYKRILKEQFNIEDSDSHELRDMNTVTEEQAKTLNLLTDDKFREFQKEVINKKLP